MLLELAFLYTFNLTSWAELNIPAMFGNLDAKSVYHIYRFLPCIFFFSSSECKFLCTNGRCLDLSSLVCDQLNHCGDNSDEENCPVSTQHPSPALFYCECLLTLFC